MNAPGIPDVPITCITCGQTIPCPTSLVDVEHDHDAPTLLLRVNTAALTAHKRLACGSTS